LELAVTLAEGAKGPGAVLLLQGGFMAGAGGAGVWAEPTAQDLWKAVSGLAWGVDYVQGDLDEIGFVGGAVDLEGRRSQFQLGMLVRGVTIIDGRAITVIDGRWP
jgi:hypothetical protein